MDELEAELEPFCYTAGLKFEGSDEKTGHWRNFFIGVVGDVDAQEEDNLWPNMVLSSPLFDVLCYVAWPWLFASIIMKEQQCQRFGIAWHVGVGYKCLKL